MVTIYTTISRSCPQKSTSYLKHKTFEHEYSPHYLLIGVTPKLDISSSSSFYTRDETTEEIEASKNDLALRKIEKLNILRNSINCIKTSQSYIRSLLAEHEAFSRSFSKGDWVLRQRERKHKFEPFYDGPFSITKCHPGNIYTLMTLDGIVMANKYNGACVFPAYHRESQPINSLW